MPHLRRTPSLAAALIGAVLLAACSSTDEDEIAYVERPVEQLYNEAAGAIERENFTLAAQLFEEVERQHPYSPWAVRAQLMAAYALYEEQKYDEAIVALDRFIQLHPGNERIDYAYYLRGLAYYDQIADPKRDQRITEQARSTLTEVVRRFPDTEYGRDARLKLDLTEDLLAAKEMEVGRFYLRQRQYPAAISRFRRVVEFHQTTNQVPEALHRLVEAYLAVGLEGEARTTAAVLGHNFPGSEWYTDSYRLMAEGADAPPPDEGSWLGRIWRTVF